MIEVVGGEPVKPVVQCPSDPSSCPSLSEARPASAVLQASSGACLVQVSGID